MNDQEKWAKGQKELEDEFIWGKSTIDKAKESMKYFTPDLQDIRVGYECEVATHRFNEGTRWDKLIVDIDLLNKVKTTDGVRVPYLTKEQIEAEGWKDVTKWFDEKKEQYLGMSPNFEFITETGSFRLYLSSMKDPSSGIVIEEYKRATGEPWSLSSFIPKYKGQCKDINTFRYICKLLKIK